MRSALAQAPPPPVERPGRRPGLAAAANARGHPDLSGPGRPRSVGQSTKTNALLSDLAGAVLTGAGSNASARNVSPHLLILDDFAVREYAFAQAEDLQELVSHCYRRGSLILTTNREPKGRLSAPSRPHPRRRGSYTPSR